MKAVNIKWETDGYDVVLPTEINLPENFEEDDFDSINDYLSDETGYLVEYYDLEK